MTDVVTIVKIKDIIKPTKLYQIESTREFEIKIPIFDGDRGEKRYVGTEIRTVRVGEGGGFIQNYDNLSQYENCWINPKCYVLSGVKIYGDALVDDSLLAGDMLVFGNSYISASTIIAEKAVAPNLIDRVWIAGGARIREESAVGNFKRKYGSLII